MMRAILIDAVAKTATEVETTGKLDDLYRLLECEGVDAVKVDEDNACYVDGEGLLADDPGPFFILAAYGHPLAKRGLILGHDGMGDTIDTNLTAKAVQASTVFPSIELVGFETTTGTTTHPMFGDSPVPHVQTVAVFRGTIDFSENVEMAAKVADRFERFMGHNLGPRYERAHYLMDLLAADGCNGNLPLRWEALLAADEYEFVHDAGGIYQHLNRTTGQLDDGFVPRFAFQ